MAKIMTVLGLISPDKLGITLIHEHLILDLSVWWKAPDDPVKKKLFSQPLEISMLGKLRRDTLLFKDNLSGIDVDLAVSELMDFKKSAGSTIVEATSGGLHRDPIKLVQIAEKTGLNVICGCGYYAKDAHPPEVSEKSIEEIQKDLIREITYGIGDTGIKPGIIGEIGTSDVVYPEEEKVLRAAIRASITTGVPVQIHLWPWFNAAPDVMNILKDEGIRSDSVQFLHLDGRIDYKNGCMDLNYAKKILNAGFFISYDNFGAEWYHDGDSVSWPSDRERIRAIVELVKEGYIEQLMVSQDTCQKLQLKKYGGWGYDHILTNVVPWLKREGLTDEQIKALLVKNPKRFLQPGK